jgi:glyoxylase-like metal-dependent hydrolase (beta-lactamase superfamily II)
MQIHQIRTPLANSYLVEYPDRILVVDVGSRCQDYVLGHIEQELAREAQDVELIICTHDDPDHIGGVRQLAVACGSPFAIPYASRSPLRKHWNDPAGWLVRFATSSVEATRPRSFKMYWSQERRSRVRERARARSAVRRGQVYGLKPDYRLKHQSILPGFEDWEVLHTPGHTWDSCCFFHAETQSLLSGDTLLGSSKKQRLVLPSVFSNRSQIRSSLRRIRQLDPRHIYPGHGSEFHGENLLVNL